MIKRIFFDLGLTLVENGAPYRYAEVFTKLGRPTEAQQAHRAYHLANKYFMREEPGRLGSGDKNTMKDFLAHVAEILEVPELAVPVFEAMAAQPAPPLWRCFPFTCKVLSDLQEDGYRLGLISNWDSSCREVLARNELDSFLDPIVVSCEVGADKPDPRIFEKALALCGEAPEECLYVGDNYYDDGVGATAVGMPFCILNPQGKLGIEELELPFLAEDIRGVHEMLRSGILPGRKEM